MLTDALIINLASATQRWNAVSAAMRNSFPDVTVNRIDAVYWRDLDLDAVPMTPLARLLVTQNEFHKHARSSHREMDTPSSVAIMLSHMRCWRWIADHPDPQTTHVLVLEDDSCPDTPGFRDFVYEHLPRLMRPQTAALWDMLVLGYFNLNPLTVPAPAALSASVGTPLIVANEFFGGHAYIIGRRGAQVLLEHALPLNEQADGLPRTLAALGKLRLYLTPHSLVAQCNQQVDRLGAFHTNVIAAWWYRLDTGHYALLITLLVLGVWALTRGTADHHRYHAVGG